MPLKNIVGVDHVVVTVRDLDAAAQNWRDLGFTVSPRGTHSEHMGTGNYTMMFDQDYIELLGVLAPTEQNEQTRRFLEKREGIERTAFTTPSAAQGAEELKARGLAAIGPVHFNRPVDLPDGTKSAAKFNVFRWPHDENPGGMRIFACEHLTRETVWIHALQTHANGARQLQRIEILTAAPDKAAAQMARLIDQPATRGGDGAWTVPSGGGRAEFVFYDAATFAARYDATAREGAGDDGCVALHIGSSDMAAVRKMPRAISAGDRVMFAPKNANGVLLVFAPAR